MSKAADRGWIKHEHDMAEMFGLDRTLTSGNKFFDKGDAVHRGRQLPFPVYLEAKYTEHASRTLTMIELYEGQQHAAEAGRRFVMAVRFYPKNAVGPEDYVVMAAHDLAELLDMVNEEDTEEDTG